jgi:sensor histidine kinase regulating citrate/malate metabolism
MINKIKDYLLIIIAFPIVAYTIFMIGIASGKDKQKVKQLLKQNEKRKKMRKARKISTSDELDNKLRKGKF